MRLAFTIVAIVAYGVSCGFSILAADEEPGVAGEDSSAGLPEDYAKNYLIAASTISPDKKFAVIYPTLELEEAAENTNHPDRIKDCVVALQPFTVLGELQTKYPYFQNQNHGGLSAEWSDDSSVCLITLDRKWGPGDVILVEFRNGKLSRMTNILRKAHDLLAPNWRKAKAERYNDYYDFVFMEDTTFKLDGASRVIIDASVHTSPNDLGLEKSPRVFGKSPPDRSQISWGADESRQRQR